MKANSIGKKLTRAFLICMLVFGTLSCLVGLQQSFRSEQQVNRHYLSRGAGLAAAVIRQMDVEELIADPDSEAYLQCSTEIEAIRKRMEFKYVYIYVPAPDGKSFTVVDISGMETGEAWQPGQVIEMELSGEVMDVFEGKSELGWKITNNQYGYVTTVYCPVYDSEGNIQAVAGADLERGPLIHTFFEKIKWTWALILAGCAAAFILLWNLSQRLVVRPVAELSAHMENFIREKEEKGTFCRIEVKSEDELGRMAEAFNHMADNVEAYLQQVTDMTAAAERTKTELDMAWKIQMGSLPDGADPYPDQKSIQLWASMDAAKTVGGDLYDHFWVTPTKLCTVIGDVSGKGIVAALFMMRTLPLIRDRVLQGEAPASVLQKVNNRLCDRNEECMFVTLFLGILDIETGVYSYACAGHNPPYLCRDAFVSLQPGKSPPLGLFEDLEYVEETVRFAGGETIFLYTDGVTEAMNEAEELFGEERMAEVLNRCRGSSCGELVEAMKKAIQDFAGETEQSDDITMLALRWNGKV